MTNRRCGHFAPTTESMGNNAFQARLPCISQPSLLLFVANKRPYFINITNKLNLEIIQWECGYSSRREFFTVRTTALMQICSARAVSQIPALFMPRSTVFLSCRAGTRDKHNRAGKYGSMTGTDNAEIWPYRVHVFLTDSVCSQNGHFTSTLAIRTTRQKA